MAVRDFVVHPNRDEAGPNLPGQNGHHRVLAPRDAPMPKGDACRARVMLPPSLVHAATSPDGSVTFSAADWRFVTCVARGFARDCALPSVLPPFGFRDKGIWHWWDGTTTDHSILEGPDAIEHVRRYLTKQFRGATIELVDMRRPPVGPDRRRGI